MKRVISLVILLFCLSNAWGATDQRSESIVTIAGESYYVHNVAQDETKYSLSHLYEVTEKQLEQNNPQIIDGLQVGQTLKIPVVKEKPPKLSPKKRSKIFDTHIVNQGETLYSISRRYEISTSTLIEDNEGLDPSHLSIGQELNIRKEQMGDTSPTEVEKELSEYRDAINSVTTDVQYHLVKRGDTLFSLSRQYGVSEQVIREANSMKEGLKVGDMLKIPLKEVTQQWEDQSKVATEEQNMESDSLERVGLRVKDIEGGAPLNISLMLPLTNSSGSGDRSYLEFYQGVLLAMEDMKAQNISAKLSLYDTSRSDSDAIVQRIVDSADFEETDLIIGPVYERNMEPVLKFAQRREIAVVFPLAVMSGKGSPLLYQMAPDIANKYDKLTERIGQDKNIIFVSTTDKDEEMESELKPLLPVGYHHIEYSGDIKTDPFDAVINRRGENIIIISCTKELLVDQILATISSKQNNLVARSMSDGDITVVGSARWARFQNNIDKNLYFKLKLHYITSYHADRNDERVRSFDNRYIESFNSIPSLYSYRGYDAAKLFVGASMRYGVNFTDKLNEEESPLQVPYHFVLKDRGAAHANNQWLLVTYHSDYSLEVN